MALRYIYRFLAIIMICSAFYVLSSGRLHASDDRMAGSGQRHKSNSARPYKASKPKKNTAEVLPIDLRELEGLGLLSTANQGSLGISLWENSNRKSITQLINDIPSENRYLTLQDLTKRALLTETSPDLIVRNRSHSKETGTDLLTVRLEKLLDLGLFQEAAALYKEQPKEPYHMRLAEAGVLALLYSGENALACLEVRVVENRFSTVSFWQQMSEICSHVLANISYEYKPEKIQSVVHTQSVVTEGKPSKVILDLTTNKRYMFKATKPSDLAKLTKLEQAALLATGKIDYKKFKLGKSSDLSSHIMAVLIADPNFSDRQRFELWLKITRKGYRSASDLAAYYETIDFSALSKTNPAKTYKQLDSWKRLPYLYQSALKAKDKKEKTAILQHVFERYKDYPAEAFLPFAPLLKESSAESFSTSFIEAVFYTNILSNQSLKSNWFTAYVKRQNSNFLQKSVMLPLYNQFSLENIPDKNKEKFPYNTKPYKDLPENSKYLVSEIYKLLDTEGKLHNYDVDSVYEKPSGLTTDDSYVMPSVGLLNNLAQARKDRRLGEVVLLSSIALHDVPPEQIDVEVFQEVLDSLITVGLTNEAHRLAKEVIMSLSRK